MLLEILLALQSYRLYACGIASKGYVVGARLPESGLMERTAEGAWRLRGFNHPEIQSLDYDPRDPRVVYLAAGNGCIRSNDGGATWRILTPWDMTELRGVSVDRNRPDDVYVALPDGIAATRDGGRTWARLRDKYTQSIRVDRTRAGRVVAGTGQGIVFTEDGGGTWRMAGAQGAMVTHVVQSPHDAKLWLATTQRHGAFRSRDGGASWERVPGIGADRTLYNAAFDPHDARRMALCGWGLGLQLSEDGGETWQAHNQGLPIPHLWRVAFDPGHPGRIYVGVHEEAAFRSDDLGRTWRHTGLDGWVVYDFVFVPEARR